MEHKKLLEIENVCFGYDKQGISLFKELSFSFTEGKITALLGANGCGKSTIVKLLSGVLQPQSGYIRLDGMHLDGWKRCDVAKKIAVVHQNNTAPGDYTVKKLVELGRTPYRKRFAGIDREADEQAVLQAMKDTDTLKYAERRIAELSGGQLQRVWLAMALAQQTDILLLDEITTYLDIHYQLELLHLIRQLNQKRKMTIIMVLHDINLAMAYCDEAIVLKEGKVLSQGKMQNVVTKKVLDEAYGVSAKVIQSEEINYCVFHRKSECYG